MGTNDLAKETRARIVPGRAPMLPWLIDRVAAARAYGLDILDGVYNELGDVEGFAAECEQARDLGFDGKTLIHPQQIAPCNAASRRRRKRSRGRARSSPPSTFRRTPARASIQLDGRMVERLHAEMARQVVAIAEAGAPMRPA